LGTTHPSVRRALFWSFAERYTSLVVTVASTMILARLLTPAQIGVFSLCAAVLTIASVIRDFGIGEYLIQEKDLTRDKIRAALALALIIAWSIAALILLLRHPIADFYAEPGVAEILGVLVINLVLLPLASPAFALLNRELAFRKVFFLQTVGGAAGAFVSVLLAYRGHGFMSLAWGTVTNTACQTLLLTFLRPRDSLLLPSLKERKSVLSYGSMYVTARIVETTSRNAHEFIIGRQFGFDAVGIFSKAFGLIELFYTNFTSALLRVTTPVFANDHRDGRSLPQRYALATSMLTAIAWPFYSYVALVSAEIIHVVFGPQWGAAAPIATILALSVMLNYLNALGPSLLASTGNVKLRLRMTLAIAPIHLAAVFVASQWGTVTAVAFAFTTSGIFGLGMYFYYLPRIMQCRTRDLLGPCGKSSIVTVACLGMQAIALVACKTHGLGNVLTLITVGMVTTLTWLATIRQCAHPIYLEILRYLEARRGKAAS
jgi:O-antigen/teichoic acid export membrane protein